MGLFKAIENDFANDTPTNKEPNNPGPLVKEIASNSSLEIPAFTKAFSTTGIIFF
jgi:hypothetical protein